jgi:hypothetical protein
MAFSLTMEGCNGQGSSDEALLQGSLPEGHVQDVLIPEQSEWMDYGQILERGEKGEWDYYISGGFTGTVTKREGIFYLYYQGARDYSEKYDTVTYRAIGVATSHDGIHFTKYRNNPVISWFPNKGIEEGAVSGGATLDENEEVVMYYGANSEQSEWLVNADGRLAVSSNGLDFSDYGIVLNHKNRKVWGFGDELFPVIAFHDNGNWYIYYIPNGTQQSGKLGVVWGPDRRNLANSRPVLSGRQKIDVWGMGGFVKTGPKTYALFLNNGRKSQMEVRSVHLDAPDQVSAPVRRYNFDNLAPGGTVYLDRERNTWFMFYQAKEYHGVKAAPVRKKESTSERF